MARHQKLINKELQKKLNRYFKKRLSEKTVTLIPKNVTKWLVANGKYPDSWVDECYWIIGSVVKLTLDKRYDESGEYVSLNSVILKKIIGNDYKKRVKHLLDSGILETDGKYSTLTHKSFGFKISDSYSGAGFRYVTLTDKRLRKVLLKFQKEYLNELEHKSKPLAHLLRWELDGGLKLDEKAALSFLNKYVAEFESQLGTKRLKGTLVGKRKDLINRRHAQAHWKIINWKKNRSFSIDNSGGRLYTKLTGLASIFRNFLSYKGQRLVYMDISNSQPFHFLKIGQEAFWKPGKTLSLSNLNRELYRWLKEQGKLPDNRTRNLISSTIMFPKSPEKSVYQVVNSGGRFSYPFLVLTGKLYRFMSAHFGGRFFKSPGVDKFSDPKTAKIQMISMMYHNPKGYDKGSKEVFRLFTSYFPEEGKQISLLKTRDYRDFPILLQKIEAQMLLHTVCKRIFEINSSIPLFTIHDGVVTTAKYAKVVQKVILETYQNEFGATPSLKISELKPDEAEASISTYVKAKIQESGILAQTKTKVDLAKFAKEELRRKKEKDTLQAELESVDLYNLSEIIRLPFSLP